MSENEVQNVDRFLKSEQKRLVGFLDVHNYSQMWMIPWGYAKENIKDYHELVSNSTVISHLTQLNVVKNKGPIKGLLQFCWETRWTTKNYSCVVIFQTMVRIDHS